MSKRPWTYEQHAAAHAYFRNLEEEKSERIRELEAVLQGMVPFIEDDFPNGTGTNHGTCATDQYQQACDAVIKALEGN